MLEKFNGRVFGKQLSKLLVIPHTKLIEHGVTFCKECISKAYYPLVVSETSALGVYLEGQKKKEGSPLEEEDQPKALKIDKMVNKFYKFDFDNLGGNPPKPNQVGVGAHIFAQHPGNLVPNGALQWNLDAGAIDMAPQGIAPVDLHQQKVMQQHCSLY